MLLTTEGILYPIYNQTAMLKNAINYRETRYHFSLSLEWTLNFKVIHYHYKGSIWTHKERKTVATTSAAVAKATPPAGITAPVCCWPPAAETPTAGPG